jgi:hypothetical protein
MVKRVRKNKRENKLKTTRRVEGSMSKVKLKKEHVIIEPGEDAKLSNICRSSARLPFLITLLMDRS